jgi:hypothetical protein
MDPRMAIKNTSEAKSSVERGAATEVFGDRPEQRRLRSLVFSLGDGLFLGFVSVVSVVVMHLIHRLGWNLALALLCGMAVAMVIQVLLAMAVAPLLGSIESMIPSMVVAMISPMAVCAFDLMGVHLHWWELFALGMGTGLAIFLLIEIYGFRCKSRLSRFYSGG